jgi:hypothetical protein
MILVACAATDVSALWLARALVQLDETVEVVTVEELGSARLEHRIEHGSSSVVLDLADGRRVDSAAVDMVVNRVVAPPTVPRQLVATSDCDYAEQELWAVTLGWLASFSCPILNPPSPMGLAGAHRSDLEWRSLAARSGLAVAGPAAAPTVELVSVLVVGGRVIGLTPHGRPVSSEVTHGLLALSVAAVQPLLGVVGTFVRGQWVFVGVDLLPQIQAGGRSVAEAVASVARQGRLVVA